MEDLIYKIGITRIPLVGAVTARTLISYCGGPRAVFEARKRELLRIPGIGEQTANNIIRQQALLEAEAEISFLEKYDVQPLFYLDPGYPRRLKHYADSPVMLYFRGNADLNAERTVAIVGTRRPSVYGRSFCEQFIEELKLYTPLIISGLAYGIDIAAHRRCVDINLPTVGVLGHGLSRIYPAEHFGIAQEMTSCGGLLTEYLSQTDPEREHFPMRNRIIAGLSDALVVVETGRRGGSMISADLANSYHKDVFAVPGRVHDRQSEGCNLLIKSHKAALLESAADLAYVMGWEKAGRPKVIQANLFAELELSEAEKLIVDLLRKTETADIDQLTLGTRKSNSEMAALLLNLEFKGLVKSMPGKRYTLVSNR